MEEETKHFCPNCKSENVEDNSIRTNNGILGPGFSSWKISDNRVCLDCGVIFIPTQNNTKLMKTNLYIKEFLKLVKASVDYKLKNGHSTYMLSDTDKANSYVYAQENNPMATPNDAPFVSSGDLFDLAQEAYQAGLKRKGEEINDMIHRLSGRELEFLEECMNFNTPNEPTLPNRL